MLDVYAENVGTYGRIEISSEGIREATKGHEIWKLFGEDESLPIEVQIIPKSTDRLAGSQASSYRCVGLARREGDHLTFAFDFHKVLRLLGGRRVNSVRWRRSRPGAGHGNDC